MYKKVAENQWDVNGIMEWILDNLEHQWRKIPGTEKPIAKATSESARNYFLV
tara:strand:+ start:3584 stop:3739 length:156 start_codon:yes stop_codon:yes gene_type:complete